MLNETHSIIKYPNKVSLANTPTPFHKLPHLSEILNVSIWIKRDDYTGAELSGNKVRKLEFVIQHAIDKGCDHLITCGGVQSNHCRATALVGAKLGLPVTLLLRNDSGEDRQGNLLLSELANAHIQIYSPRDYRNNIAHYFEEEKKRVEKAGRKAWLIPTGASDEIGIWGYIHAMDELHRDFSREKLDPDAIVVATGSGGTHAGLFAGSQLLNLSIPIIGMAVCDDEQYFLNKVDTDIQQWKKRYSINENIDAAKAIVIDKYIGPGYAKADSKLYAFIRWITGLEGVVLDPVYTAKAFYGMCEEIRHGSLKEAKDVVFVHTGGIFGLFAQSENLASSNNNQSCFY